MPSLFKQIQAGMLWDFHGGVHPPARKQQTSQRPIAVLPLPDRLYIPLRQHIGVAGQLLVKVGDQVLKGQALTSADNSMALPVHAPTSGSVVAIIPHTSAHPSALPELTLIMAPDGKDEWREREPLNFINCDKTQILNRIHDSGIAGMGGAGFPTHLKAGMTQPVDYLIINAVECEPYISADDALMQPESRAAYARFLADGWTDAIRTHNPRGGVWTFWDYQAGAWQRDHGFRIDHLLLSPQAADRLSAIGVDKDHRGREKASDHAPTWVELRA